MDTKQAVGTIICPACGKQTPVKVNKNGILFTYCMNEINEDTGDKCYHRITWGRAASRNFLKNNNVEVLSYGANGDIRKSEQSTREHGGDEYSTVWGV